MRHMWWLLVCLAACGGGKNTIAGAGFNYNGDWQTQDFDVDSENRDKLDILLVVDNSSSMSEARAALAGKLDALLDSINDRDWQIAIATTDIRHCLLAIITPQDDRAKFADTINAVSHKTGDKEEAIKVAIRALRGMPLEEDGCGNDSEPVTWRRKGKESALAIIIVTDEDHQCDKVDPNDQCELQELYDILKLMDYVPRVTAKLYGFLNPAKQSKFLSWKDKAGEPLFASVKAVKSSEQQYESVLKDISIGLDGIYQSRFTLKHTHDGKKAEVSIVLDDDTVQTLTEEQYGFTGKDLVIISSLPNNTKQIRVSYSYEKT
ncbi:MAG: hypothetical protein OYH77_07125 [Pseudomonadota bacterium]|nr:hypothetical protein [Pseudomonadota bacterium]